MCVRVCVFVFAGSAKDGCPAVEPVVLYNLRDNQFYPMAQYYLIQNSSGLTLPQALNQSNLVNIVLINTTVRMSHAACVYVCTCSFAWGRLQYEALAGPCALAQVLSCSMRMDYRA